MTGQELLGHYAPYVYLHSEEDYFPSSIDFYLEHTKLLDASGEKPILHPRTAKSAEERYEQLVDSSYKERQGWYLEVTDPDTCYKGQKPDGNGVGEGCYAYVQKAEKVSYLYYWFFYPFNGSMLDTHENHVAFELLRKAEKLAKLGPEAWNPFHGDTSGNFDLHEGDWEHIIVSLPSGAREPDKVYVSAHSGGSIVGWNQITRYQGTDHPTIYSARHSHACYATDGGPSHEHTDKSIPKLFTWLPADMTIHDLTNQGTAWKTWEKMVVVPYDQDGPTADGFDRWQAKGQEWLKYSGHWGKKWGKDAPLAEHSGPDGPAYHREWRLGHPDDSYGG